jgi:CHAD domain-containing protein
MAYAIDKGERLSEAMPRIVMERVQLALEQLLDEKAPEEERIHNARKRFKESRAAVRLLRFSLGDQFEVENVWFRDAGRDLAALRDADAVLEAADKLADVVEGFHDRRVMRRLRRRLLHAQKRAKSTELQSRIDNTAQQLSIAKARITLWPALPDDFSAIGRGLKRTFRDGRRACRRAIESPSAEAFHEWRKRVKDHWYHVQMLRNLWPAFTRPYRDEMERLSDALGDRHDLDVLRQVVATAAEFGTEFDRGVMHGLIDRRAGELTGQAIAIGERVYADPPLAIYSRFEAYWTIWSATSSSTAPISSS